MDPFKVLFVCWGNICRSPAAHCVFQKKIQDRGLDDQIVCDSAGTINAHAGSPPDTRMQQAGARRSIPFFGQSRKYRHSDFDEFDLILAMDRSNLEDLRLDWPERTCRAELKLFGYFVNPESAPDVPDPYYGGSRGFETVLDMVEEGCDQLIEYILNR